MWIRSQTKNALVNINFMCMCNESDGWVIYCESPGGVTYRLGVYSSEEKALKVLDEIQELIYFNAKDNGFTYQMPQDEDVEV